MFTTKCPKCKTSVEVVDEDTAWIRCYQCKYKIRLGRDADEDDEKIKKKRKTERLKAKKARTTNYLMELLPIGICVVISVVFLLLTCVVPKLLPVALIGGMAISLVGFVKACMLATNEGNYIAFDYFNLGGLLYVVLFFFCGLYMQVYMILWWIVQFGCATKQPKIFLPWIGLQVYGVLVMFAGAVCAAVGHNLFGS